MFTGLVQSIATVSRCERRGHGARLLVTVPLTDLEVGESICVDGACLTVAATPAGGFEADVSAETLRVTTLGRLRAGSIVNLERALALGERLGGHLVLGHVDGVAEVRSVEPFGDAREVAVTAPAGLGRYLAVKGSVALAGVSLTINRLFEPDGLTVMLVAHTLAATTLGRLEPGAEVNLEVDVLARYVVRQLGVAGTAEPEQLGRDEAIMAKLREGGFLA